MITIKRLVLCMGLAPMAAFANIGEPITFEKLVTEDHDWIGVQVYKAEQAMINKLPDEAASHYIRAIESGLSAGINNLAVLIKAGALTDEKVLESISEIEKMAYSDVELSSFLGDFYHTHKTLGDNKKAFKWFNNAMRLGDTMSLMLVGQYALEKKGGADKVYNSVDALTLFKEYSDKTDDPFITFELAKYLYEGEIVRRDYKTSANLFLKAAKGGIVEANYWLGYMHEKGIGVAKDIDRAERFYLESLGGQKDKDTYFQLARIHMYGHNGMDGDMVQGLNYLGKSHELGNLKASYRFGIMYLYGTDGFKLDVEKAIHYLDAAAQGGYRLATQKLIDVFRNGAGGVLPSHQKTRAYEKLLKA